MRLFGGRRSAGSVYRWVLGAFTATVAVFGSLLVYALVEYRRTTAELRLIDAAHLPLVGGMVEVQSTQLIFTTLLDRVSDSPADPLARQWLHAVLQYRPVALSRLIGTVGDALRGDRDLPAEEREFLRETRSRLRDVRRRYRLHDLAFSRLFYLLDAGRFAEAARRVERLKRSERRLHAVLGAVTDDVRRHVREVSRRASVQALRATWMLIAWSAAALGGFVVVAWSVRRRLAPLGRLQRAVAQVAAGDFSVHTPVERADEIGALASAVNEMARQLTLRDRQLIRQERLATAGRAAAQMTHEVRNPLTSLDLNADLLEEELRAQGVAGDALDLLTAMRGEIERLVRVTDAYLRFARLPAPQRAACDLAALVTDVAAFWRAQFEQAQIALTVDAPSPAVAWVDPEQVRQVVVNLIKNAGDAAGSGGRVHVSVALADGEEVVVLRVRDDGPGVPQEVVSTLFDPFVTTKGEGTGLGLSVVRQICLAHGGDVRYIPDDTGTVFEVTLPARPVERKDEESSWKDAATNGGQ